jgi:hypothetical protein
MALPPGFDPQHPGEQAGRFGLRDVGEIGDKRNRIAALVARREVRPTAL